MQDRSQATGSDQLYLIALAAQQECCQSNLLVDIAECLLLTALVYNKDSDKLGLQVCKIGK